MYSVVLIINRTGGLVVLPHLWSSERKAREFADVWYGAAPGVRAFVEKQ